MPAQHDITEVWFEDLGTVAVKERTAELHLGSHDVLIAPKRIGICGSDMHVLHGKHPFVKPPLVTGHEAVAEVLEVGTAVDADLVGQRVLVNPLVAPSHDHGDWRDAINVQEDARVIGFKLPGLAATRTVVPVAQLHVVPDSLDATTAVLAEPIAAGIHAARRPGARLQEVVIIGGGTIGLAVLLGALAEGAQQVTVVEPVAAKRELALRLGAHAAVEPDAELPARSFTTVFDCVSAPATLMRSIELTRGGGAVIMMGVPGAAAVDMPLPRMQRFEIDLLGSGMYTDVDIDAALAYLARGSGTAAHLVTAVYALADAADAYDAVADPTNVKVVLSL